MHLVVCYKPSKVLEKGRGEGRGERGEGREERGEGRGERGEIKEGIPVSSSFHQTIQQIFPLFRPISLDQLLTSLIINLKIK